MQLIRTVIAALLCLTVIGCSPIGQADTSNASTKLLDINSASADQLETLPGIGDAYSREIIANRPYNRTDELVEKKVVPQASYDVIKDLIVANKTQ